MAIKLKLPQKPDIIGAIESVQAAGLIVSMIEIKIDGRIAISTQPTDGTLSNQNEWDDVLSKPSISTF